MGLQAAYANLHTGEERDYFMQRYHDDILSSGGKPSYDADSRPLLVMRSNLWASGYDVVGTDQTSLGQFSGRVQQTYKHSVPRFFVPEHGTMFTLALVRFPPTATKEIQYLNAKGALTYTDIAGDPVLYGNLPVWFALSLLRFRLPSRLPMMFILWMVAMMVVIIPSRTV